MILEYIRYRLAEGQRTAFEAAYEKAQAALQASSHCLGYELSRCVEESGCYILRIEWDSPDGHLKGFRSSPEFQTFFSHVRPFVDNIEEMRHYEATRIRSAE
jgi:quinol monooxygenase YgiN